MSEIISVIYGFSNQREKIEDFFSKYLNKTYEERINTTINRNVIFYKKKDGRKRKKYWKKYTWRE